MSVSRKISLFLLFQGAWFACILGAANHCELMGTSLGVLCVVLMVFLTGQLQKTVRLIIKGCALGILFDSALIQAGLISFESEFVRQLSPPWMWVLWAALMASAEVSLTWAKERLVLITSLGAIFAPLSYAAGIRLGAASVENIFLTSGALAILWTMATPILMSWLRVSELK